MSRELDIIDRGVSFLRPRLGRPDVVIVLGSGMSGVLRDGGKTFSYEKIPGFPKPSVQGHAGRLTSCRVGGLNVAILRGRVHLYEGYLSREVVRPVRILARLGARVAVLTNAAGAVHPKFRPGDLMVIEDHLNFLGANPLEGENLAGFGPRFPDLSHAYDPELCRLLLRLGGKKMRRGVYAAMRGPSFETPAEIRMLQRLGTDAVGMSTVPEVIAAVHAGMRVAAISCITNIAAGLQDQPLNHEEVMEVTARMEKTLGVLLEKFLRSLGESGWLKKR